MAYDVSATFGQGQAKTEGSFPIVYSLIQASNEWISMKNIAIIQIDDIITKINKIPKKIVTKVKVDLDFGLFGLNIPSFQTGGIMPHTGLAMLHKGETVTPEGGSGGITINIENVYGTDPDEMAEALQEKLNMMIST